MKLEELLRKNVNRRNVLENIRMGLPFTLFLFGCSSDDNKTTITGNIDIRDTTKSIGMIQGKVTIPGIENNQIVYKTGLEGANIEVIGTDFETTSIKEGLYAIDGIPTGSYNIKASKNSYTSDIKPTIIVKGNITTVPNLNLTPERYISGRDSILYGKIYDIDRKNPFANKKVNLYHIATRDGEITPGSLKGSTITSSDGSYAFYISLNTYILDSEGVKIKFMNPIDITFGMDSYEKYLGLLKKDAFVSEYL